MSIEHREPEALRRVEADKMTSGSLATATQNAIETVRRAGDHAVMAIFELAFLVESLDDVIRRYNAETEHQLGVWRF